MPVYSSYEDGEEMSRCLDVRMSGCLDVTMSRCCQDVSMSGCQDVTVTACNTCRCGAGVQEGGLASILLQTEQVPQVLALDPHDARHQEPAAGGPQHREQQGPLQLQPHQGEGGASVIYKISLDSFNVLRYI